MKTFVSNLSNSTFPLKEKVYGRSIRQSIMQLIQEDYPDFTKDNVLAKSELEVYRGRNIDLFMKRSVGRVTSLEKRVSNALKERKPISDVIEHEEVYSLTFGQRTADSIATFGGSWTFIIMFIIFIFGWISLNVFWLANQQFDPFPFILLNLILSTLAALQAPVIMMSQNRQAEKDRETSKKDYMVNLKAELEIGILNEKIDHLIINEQQEMQEMHRVQNEMLGEILKRIEEKL